MGLYYDCFTQVHFFPPPPPHLFFFNIKNNNFYLQGVPVAKIMVIDYFGLEYEKCFEKEEERLEVETLLMVSNFKVNGTLLLDSDYLFFFPR